MNLESPRLRASKEHVARAPYSAAGVATHPAAGEPDAVRGPEPNGSEPEGTPEALPQSRPGAAPEHDAPPVTAANPPTPSSVNQADLAALRLKDLLIPVTGVIPSRLRDSFYEGRPE